VKKKRAQIVIVPNVSANHADAAKRVKAAVAADSHKKLSDWIRVHIMYKVIYIVCTLLIGNVSNERKHSRYMERVLRAD